MKPNQLISSLATTAIVLGSISLFEQPPKASPLDTLDPFRVSQSIGGEGSEIRLPSPNRAMPSQSVEELQQQISRYREAGDRENEAATLISLGTRYISLNQFTKAMETYNQALALYRQVKDRIGEGSVIRSLANLYADSQANLTISNLVRTNDFANHIQSTANPTVGNTSTLPNAYANNSSSGEGTTLGTSKPEKEPVSSTPFRSGTNSELAIQTGRRLPFLQNPVEANVQEAKVFAGGLNTQVLALRQQALAIYRELNDRPKQAETLDEIGSTYLDFGQYPKALESYQKALKLYQALGNSVGSGSTFNNLGEVYRKQGQFSKALNFYDQALALLRAGYDYSSFGPPISFAGEGTTLQGTNINRYEGEGAILNNIGLVHSELGQYVIALSFYQRSLEFRRQSKDLRGIGTALHNIGFTYDQMAQNKKALQFYQDALIARREAGDIRGEALTLNNLGLVYNDQKQYPKALEQLQSALKTFEALDARSNTGNTLDSIATVYKSLKQYSTAQDYYQRAIAVLREVGDRNTLGISLTNLGDLYEQKGDKPKAIAAYQQAIDESLETILADLKGDELQAAFSTKHADTYAHLISLLWDTGRFEDAFNYVERAKARAFLNQMAGEPVNLRAGVETTLLKREQTQRAELTDLNNQLKNFSNRVLGEEDKQVIAQLKANLDARQQSYAQFLEQLQRQNPEAADLVSVNPAKLADIQQLLDQNTTLVEYFVTDDRTFTFLITRNSFKAVPLHVGRSALTEAVRSLYEYDFATLQNPHPASLKQLHQWLIQPLKSQISTRKLKVVPHNILHYVPFAALTDGQKFLIDDYTLSTLPSASVMRFLAKKHKPDNGKLLVFGNPTLDLSYASQEANTVAEMYKTQAIIGAKATKDALQAQAKQDSILHLATHGEFNPINPLFSALYLAPNKGKDDRLEVHEIYELDLTKATNLVVLSACQSQVGELSRGDELVGLSRAFLYAGTPNVIASLWNIDDQATGLLMQKFYGYLRQGNRKAEALQKAQREVRTEYAHPYYWAAFVLTGDGD